ncbi:MAG TPA: hypothetical protein VK585_10235 [Jiangellaceae bacterium]|nr:hypothetical protein [Jiangellaceae bacterium]
MTPTVVVAHGVGGRQDLPIPFGLAVAGAVTALVVSFLVLRVAWRRSRFRGDRSGRPLPVAVTRAADSPWTRWALRLLGLVAGAYVALGAVAGPDLATNPTAGVVYVLLWVGMVPLSLLFGPVWRLVNPLRTLHLLLCRAVRLDPAVGLRSLPAGAGLWPAAAWLAAFTWLELVAPDRATLPVIRAWFAVFVGVTALGAVVFGSRWFDHADPFEAYSSLVARLSWLGRRHDGRLVARNPLENLDVTPPWPGLTATVAVLLGSTMFDSASASPWWARWVQESGLPPTLAGTVGLLTAMLLVYLTFTLAVRWTAALAGSDRRGLSDLFAHSVVPIVVGYVSAHYLTLFVLEGQRTVVLLADPLGTGANWLGTAGLAENRWIAGQPTLVASIQVAAIVVGHVLGIVSAHDRAVRLFPAARPDCQLPLLVVMVCYTVGGLLLLFAA